MEKRIVITGNIGSGKSTVTGIFEQEGYKVISADKISAKILENYHQEITKMFKMPAQKFDTFKKTLSNRVFTYPEEKKELEKFMLPRIKMDIKFWSDLYKDKGRKYVVELPTYFENGPFATIKNDIVINVIADKATRISRVLERNKHLSIQDVLDRMSTQADSRETERMSNHNIFNDYNYNSLETETLAVKYIIERDN